MTSFSIFTIVYHRNFELSCDHKLSQRRYFELVRTYKVLYFRVITPVLKHISKKFRLTREEKGSYVEIFPFLWCVSEGEGERLNILIMKVQKYLTIVSPRVSCDFPNPFNTRPDRPVTRTNAGSPLATYNIDVATDNSFLS